MTDDDDNSEYFYIAIAVIVVLIYFAITLYYIRNSCNLSKKMDYSLFAVTLIPLIILILFPIIMGAPKDVGEFLFGMDMDKLKNKIIAILNIIVYFSIIVYFMLYKCKMNKMLKYGLFSIIILVPWALISSFVLLIFAMSHA